MDSEDRYVTVRLQGGLGNLLFQIAALFSYAETFKRKPFLFQETTPGTPHSSEDYFTSILANFKYLVRTDISFQEVFEPHQLDLLASKERAVCVIGYFQYWKMALNLPPKLVMPEEVLAKYPDVHECVFFHIRGGDYLIQGANHYKPMKHFYKEALKEFRSDTKFLVFTNDKVYAEQFLPLLHKYQIVDENPVDSLLIMSRCRGGICPNSTFSWWGGFLNPNRRIIIPAIWNQVPNFMFNEGYRAPQWVVLEN